MSGIATAIVGGAVIGGISSDRAADSAADSTAAGIAEQRRQFDLSRRDLGPWRRAGQGAVNTLARNWGDSFKTSPGYNFVRKEGNRDILNSFGAGGGAFSGNALRALNTFNSGLASQEYGNWWNRGAGMAGVGQSAAGTGVMAGQDSANNISGLLGQQGDARASGIMGVGNSINSGINNWLNYRMYSGGGFGGPGGFGSGTGLGGAR